MEGLAMGNLTALAVKNAKAGDKLGDGDGLRLDVDKNGNASWLFRFRSPVTGKERFMGLGPLREVGLGDAREAKGVARALLRNNIDPIEHRIRARTSYLTKYARCQICRFRRNKEVR